MTDDQYIALGKIFAAHSFMTRNVVGVLGHLVENPPKVTGVLYPFIAPADRVRLCIHLLELDAQNHRVTAAAYQRLDTALRGVLDKMLVEFSMPDVGMDFQKFVRDDATPWDSLTLDVDPLDLECGASDIFSQAAELLASVAVYLDKRTGKNEETAAG
jgi:hypothetical protein